VHRSLRLRPGTDRWDPPTSPTTSALRLSVRGHAYPVALGVREDPEARPRHVLGRLTNRPAKLRGPQLSWSVGQTIAPAVLLGLLSAGPRWLWATTIALCRIVFLGIDHLTPATSAATTTRNRER